MQYQLLLFIHQFSFINVSYKYFRKSFIKLAKFFPNLLCMSGKLIEKLSRLLIFISNIVINLSIRYIKLTIYKLLRKVSKDCSLPLSELLLVWPLALWLLKYGKHPQLPEHSSNEIRRYFEPGHFSSTSSCQSDTRCCFYWMPPPSSI